MLLRFIRILNVVMTRRLGSEVLHFRLFSRVTYKKSDLFSSHVRQFFRFFVDCLHCITFIPSLYIPRLLLIPSNFISLFSEKPFVFKSLLDQGTPEKQPMRLSTWFILVHYIKRKGIRIQSDNTTLKLRREMRAAYSSIHHALLFTVSFGTGTFVVKKISPFKMILRRTSYYPYAVYDFKFFSSGVLLNTFYLKHKLESIERIKNTIWKETYRLP